jgi:anti-sigma factor RsiW
LEAGEGGRIDEGGDDVDCRGFDLILDDLADGSLAGPVKEQADLHVASCERCARDLAAYRSTVDAIATLRQRPFSDAVFSRQHLAIMSRVAPAWQWQASPLSLVALLTVTAGLVAMGSEPLGVVLSDFVTEVAFQGGRTFDASITLLPLYAMLAALALFTLTERERPALATATARGAARAGV